MFSFFVYSVGVDLLCLCVFVLCCFVCLKCLSFCGLCRVLIVFVFFLFFGAVLCCCVVFCCCVVLWLSVFVVFDDVCVRCFFFFGV